MSIDPIGIAAFLVGLLILRNGPDFGVIALVVAGLLGAAAAIKLPALGGSNITVAYLILAFYILAILREPWGVPGMIGSLAYPNPGFWYLGFAVFAVVSAFFLPRIFAGEILVFSISRSAPGEPSAIMLTLLRPGSSNITQSVYLMGELALFAGVVAHVAARGARAIVIGLLAAAALNCVLGAADAVTHALRQEHLLAPIRNANYAILTEGDVGGMRRTIGSFPEASAFGGASLVLFAFALELYLSGYKPRITALIAVGSLAAVLASMSSSALVGLGAYGLLLCVRRSFSMLRGTASVRDLLFLTGLAIFTALLGLALVLNTELTIWGEKILNQLLLNKLESDSGIERSMWNTFGMDAFFDTGWIGAGAGSIRTSSYAVALLANTGLLGFCLMALFFLAVSASVFGAKNLPKSVSVIRTSAWWACVVALMPALLAGPTILLGLFFVTLAGLATATPQSVTERHRQQSMAMSTAVGWQQYGNEVL